MHSVEGWVAHKVYKRRVGQSVFRRIVPLVRILEAAGIAVNDAGVVRLTPEFQRELESLQYEAPQREEDLEATF